MVDKWKRFASEMGRYWMEFIPIQLALCHQVCPTENRYYIQQEQFKYNFSCLHKMVIQDDFNCPLLVNVKKGQTGLIPIGYFSVALNLVLGLKVRNLTNF